MKCVNISCLGARCVSSRCIYVLKQGIHWQFFCFSLFIYKLTQLGSVENIVLYHKNIIKIITICHTVVGISSSRRCGFWVCVVGVWGCRQALNRLEINRFFWRKMIWSMRTPRWGLVQLLTLIGYRRGLSEIAEVWRPLRVFNTNRPVPWKFRIRITSTSTNTVVVVYHTFATFTKVQI